MQNVSLPTGILCNLIHENRLFHGIPVDHYKKQWTLRALSGALVELSGMGATARLTLAARLIADAQQQGNLVAWSIRNGESFFPPDMKAAGVDLEALTVIRLNDYRSTFRANEYLLKSGAFGLVVMDIGSKPFIPQNIQVRLAVSARRHNTTLLCLTEKGLRTPSLGALFAVHGYVVRKTIGEDRFSCELRILKDKRRGPAWNYVEICHGQDGLY